MKYKLNARAFPHIKALGKHVKEIETPGVNFINVFMHSFYAHRSQNCKKLLDLTVSFALLGSVCVKAARKMLVKLLPDG